MIKKMKNILKTSSLTFYWTLYLENIDDKKYKFGLYYRLEAAVP